MFVPGGWRGRAQTAFTGRQAFLLLGAPFIGLVAAAVGSLLDGGRAAILAGTVATLAAGAGGFRKRRALVLVLDPHGVASEGYAPIGPLADIERFEMVHHQGTIGAPLNRIFVHRRRGATEALVLNENDPVYLRFIVQQLEAAMSTLRESGYRD
jgi:hypothetical protein